MKTFTKKISYLAGLGLLLCTVLNAQEIIIGYSDWPPFVSKEMPQEGASNAFVASIFTELGHTVRHTSVPWARVIDYAKSGQISVIPAIWYKKEREEFLLFSKPYQVGELRFISLKQHPISITNLPDIKNYRVGGVIGYTYVDTIEKFTTMVNTSNLTQQVNMLKFERVDCVLADPVIFLHKAKGILSKQDLALSDYVYSKEKLYVGFSKKYPNNVKNHAEFNKKLQEKLDNGEAEAFFDKFGITITKP